VVRRSEINAEIAQGADQIIVGRNATRKAYNNRMRQLGERESDLPEPGEKIICLKNNHDMGLLNGTLWGVRSSEHAEQNKVLLEVADWDKPDDDPFFVTSFTNYFQGLEPPAHYEFRDAESFDYGYAITCHKSQGSQWNNVLVIDESSAFQQDAKKWLYTAITRASKKVTVVSG
jgi:exodeoxyribonuclease-5